MFVSLAVAVAPEGRLKERLHLSRWHDLAAEAQHLVAFGPEAVRRACGEDDRLARTGGPLLAPDPDASAAFEDLDAFFEVRVDVSGREELLHEELDLKELAVRVRRAFCEGEFLAGVGDLEDVA